VRGHQSKRPRSPSSRPSKKSDGSALKKFESRLSEEERREALNSRLTSNESNHKVIQDLERAQNKKVLYETLDDSSESEQRARSASATVALVKPYIDHQLELGRKYANRQLKGAISRNSNKKELAEKKRSVVVNIGNPIRRQHPDWNNTRLADAIKREASTRLRNLARQSPDDQTPEAAATLALLVKTQNVHASPVATCARLNEEMKAAITPS
jgi:hypothetical protein